MRRFLAVLLGLILGYVVFAVLGYGAIGLFSANQFDVSVEAAMTAAFAIGPAGALIGAVAGFVLARRRKPG